MSKYIRLRDKIEKTGKSVRMHKKDVKAKAELDKNGYVILTCSKERECRNLVLYLSPVEFNLSSWSYK